MAEYTISTKTQRLTREQLAAAVGNNPRLIRLLENLLSDVADTLPQAVSDVDASGRFSLQGADGSKAMAFDALRHAESVEALLSMTRTQATRILELERQVAELGACLHQVAHLKSAVHQLKRDVEDARTLSIGI
jgi:ubiquinone biosynthesis protein UbiJ